MTQRALYHLKDGSWVELRYKCLVDNWSGPITWDENCANIATYFTRTPAQAADELVLNGYEPPSEIAHYAEHRLHLPAPAPPSADGGAPSLDDLLSKPEAGAPVEELASSKPEEPGLTREDLRRHAQNGRPRKQEEAEAEQAAKDAIMADFASQVSEWAAKTSKELNEAGYAAISKDCERIGAIIGINPAQMSAGDFRRAALAWIDRMEVEERVRQHVAGEKARIEATLPGEGKSGVPTKHGKRKRRGRPIDTNLKEDSQIFNAWKTGQHADYEDLGRRFHKSKREVRQIIDRESKRRSRDGASEK
jgi:hypothetical protein